MKIRNHRNCREGSRNGRFWGKQTLICIIVMLFLVIVYNGIQASTFGAILQNIETKEEKLLKETAEIRTELVYYTSLSELNKHAFDAGFSKPERIVYLSKTDNITALR